MSLLDSILGSMNKPKPSAAVKSASLDKTAASTDAPSQGASSGSSSSSSAAAKGRVLTAAERASQDMLERFRQEQALIQKKDREQKQALLDKATAEIKAFMANPELQKLECPVMDQMKRTIVHSVADEFGLVSHSFGEEGVDRHIVMYKPEFAPTSDELEQMNDPEGYKIRKEAHAKMEEQAKNPPKMRRRRPAAELDNSLIHQVEVVKRDTRSIEELQFAIRAQKSSSTSAEGSGSSDEAHEVKKARLDREDSSSSSERE